MGMANLGNYILRVMAIAVLVSAFAAGISVPAEAADVNWAAGFPKLTEDKVLLMWDAVGGADSYKVYRRRGDQGDYLLLTTSKVNRYIDEKPGAGQTYYYNVVAMKGEEQLGKSEDRQVSIAAEKAFVAMTVPKLVGAIARNEADGNPGVGLRWEVPARPSELAAYNVYRSEKKGGPYTLIGSAQSMEYKDLTDLVRGKTYYYVVSAVDTNFKETKYSNEMSADIEVIREYIPEGKKPTAMMRTKHLFDISKYREFKGKNDKTGVEYPVEFPVDVSVDEAVGHIYIVSNGYGGVLAYNMEGKFQFGFRAEGRGSEKKIRSTHGIDVGPGGKVYVVAYQESNIYIYDIDGKLDSIIEVNYREITGEDPPPGKVPVLYDVVVNSMGDIFVTDPTFNRVHVYDYSGKHKFDIDGAKKRPGSDERLFNGPGYMYIFKDDHILFPDTSTGDMLEFDSEGKFVRVFVEGAKTPGEAGRPYRPVGVCIDDKDRVFIANGLDPNIQVFDRDGNLLFALANEKLDGPIKSNSMRGIFVDNKGRLYVTEVLTETLAVYQLSEKVEEIVVPSKTQ